MFIFKKYEMLVRSIIGLLKMNTDYIIYRAQFIIKVYGIEIVSFKL